MERFAPRHRAVFEHWLEQRSRGRSTGNSGPVRGENQVSGNRNQNAGKVEKKPAGGKKKPIAKKGKGKK